MRLPNTAHTFRPWRIRKLTRDFRLEDVWALPTPARACSRHLAAGDPHRFRTDPIRTTTALLDEVLPECLVDVFSGWLRRDFLHRIARIAEGSA